MGVAHDQPIKDVRAKDRVQIAPGDHLQHAPDYVDANGIFPPRARRKGQRQGGDGLALRLQCTRIGFEQQILRRHFLRDERGIERIAEPRCMGQQLVQCRRRAGFRLVKGCGSGDQRTAVGKLRQERRHGHVQRHIALFQQDHQRHGRHRLGHRIDARHGLAIKGCAGGQIPRTARAEIDLVALLFDQDRQAGELTLLDIAVDPGVDVFQAVGIKGA
mmetsp:Transcript_22697/g.37372  ORF Transcript_22697/g.37372 Transcript_22697/m.37372 type:complete len:217 (-) Transcript_22697:5161-5811(-)